jgi:hypothetical protein
LRGGISPFSGWSYADDHSKIARKASGPTRTAVQSLRHSSLDVGIDLIFGGTALMVIAVYARSSALPAAESPIGTAYSR